MNVISPISGSSQARGVDVPDGVIALKTSARQLMLLLDRRKWQMAGVVLLIMVGVAVVLAQMTPIYRATALVMLDSRKVRVTKVEDVLSGVQTADFAALQTEVEVLRSRSLLGRVVDRLKLNDDPEFVGGSEDVSPVTAALRWIRAQIAQLRPSPPAPADGLTIEERRRTVAIDRMQDRLSTAPRGRSYVIALSFDSPDSAKATRITNTIAEEYIFDQLNAKLEANKKALEWLSSRLIELRAASEASDRALARFRDENNLTAIRDATVATQSLSELNTQLNIAQVQLAERESRLAQLLAAQRNPGGSGAISEVLSNPLIATLRAQEAEIARRAAELAQRYGDAHPRLIQVRAERADIAGKIAAEIAKIASSVRTEVDAARSKVAQLRAQVDAVERTSGAQGQLQMQAKQLERDAEANRQLLTDFQRRFKELREQQEIQQPDARELSRATVPSAPAYPRYLLTIIAALALAVVAAVSLAILLERLDGGYRSSEQVESKLGLPAVGMIPGLSALTLRGQSPARFATGKPTSAYGESLRSAHTAIMLGSLDSPPKVIMTTSSLPDEGKTTFSVSLAGLLAKANPSRRIIVVDCDLRRSSVAKTLGVTDRVATVDDYLSGAKPLEEVIRRDEASGTWFVPARRNTPNAADILDSNAMKRFVAQLAATYDLVILDTPPVMAVSDARIVSRLADYVVFLVRWERTPRELVNNAVRLLRAGNQRIGVVLSQVNVRRHSKYGYGDMGYYYSKYRSYYTK